MRFHISSNFQLLKCGVCFSFGLIFTHQRKFLLHKYCRRQVERWGLFLLLNHGKLCQSHILKTRHTSQNMLMKCTRYLFIFSAARGPTVVLVVGRWPEHTMVVLSVYRMVLDKLLAEKLAWTPLGYTKYIALCQHTRTYCRKINVKRSKIQKVCFITGLITIRRRNIGYKNDEERLSLKDIVVAVVGFYYFSSNNI